MSTRKVEHRKEKVRLIDKTTIERKALGDVIFLPAPRTPDDRPTDETVIYRGEKGATAALNYDADGFLKNGIINCPEVDEWEQRYSEMEYQKKEKDSERSFNIEFGKLIRGTLLGMTLIIVLGWIVRGWVMRK